MSGPVKHEFDAVIVGAGGAGLYAALEASHDAGKSHGRRLQAAAHPQPHRHRPGRHRGRAGQRGAGRAPVACLRHGQRRRLPRRPAGGGHSGRGRRAVRLRAGEPRPALQPDRGRADRPATVRRAHEELRRGPRPAGLLRRRPHRAHDPADPLPTVHQERRRVLRRVPARGRAPRRAHAARGW